MTKVITPGLSGMAVMNAAVQGTAEAVMNAAPPHPEVAKGALGRFLDFYQKANERHPYLTGVATASAVYIVGDTVAQCIMPGKPVNLGPANVAMGVGMSLYYGWESPLIFRVIDRAFPLDKAPASAEHHADAVVEGAAMMTGALPVRNGLVRLARSFGRAIAGIGRLVAGKRRELTRAAAYRIPIAPFWTMRHMGVLAAVHGSSATSMQLAGDSISIWASWLPLLFVEEYIVQNKIPLQFRFLATSAVCFLWQISASLVALLRC